MEINTKDTLETSENLRIIKEYGDKKIISIRRWGDFTKTLLNIEDKDIEIHDIGGNDEIVVSVLLDNSNVISFNNIEMLYESNVVTKKDTKRIIYNEFK